MDEDGGAGSHVGGGNNGGRDDDLTTGLTGIGVAAGCGAREGFFVQWLLQLGIELCNFEEGVCVEVYVIGVSTTRG